MDSILLIIHILVCIVLVISILLQSSKGRGLSGAFGGMGGSSVLGGVGAATFLSKVTTYAGVFFFLTCIGLWYTAKSQDTLPDSAAERMLQQKGPVPLTAPRPLAPTETTTEDKPATTTEEK